MTWMDTVFPFVGNLSIYRCGAVSPNASSYNYHHYGYNGYLGGRMAAQLTTMDITSSAAYSPEKVVVTADYNLLWAYYMNDSDWKGQAQNPPPSPPGQTAANHLIKQRAVYPHNQRSIVSFADGSVGYAEVTDPNWYSPLGASGHFDPRSVR